MSEAGPSKRPRLYTFQKEWEDEYCFVEIKENAVCLLCNRSVTTKKYNIERHYKLEHEKFHEQYMPNSAVRKEKINTLKKALVSQQSLFKKVMYKSKNVTLASFKISHFLLKNKKSYLTGELFKNALLAGADSLFNTFSNKQEIVSAINDLQLSRNSLQRRATAISTNINDQLESDMNKCSWFSLQMDESLDLTGTAQLIIITRMSFEDYSVKEEMLCLLPLKEKTRGEDIYLVFKNFVLERKLPLHKLSSITTDGAPAMIGKNKGFVRLCTKDELFPKFFTYHCIVHQQVLCSKVLSLNHVLNPITKIINSIKAAPLQHRLFKKLLEDNDTEYSDLLTYTEVRWLSKGKVLQRFLNLIVEIKAFLEEKGDIYDFLDDVNWLCDLSFLTDICQKLNQLNLELQGQNKDFVDMVSTIKAFKAKLTLWISHFRNKSFTHFPQMTKIIQENQIDSQKYVNYLTKLSDNFNERFKQFDDLELIILFFENPMNNVDVSVLSTELNKFHNSTNIQNLELEIIELQNDVALKAVNMDKTFWKYVNSYKYPILKNCALKLKSFFGSTYLSEATFSSMQFIKNKFRSNITDKNLNDCLKIAVSNYSPDFEKLCEEIQHQPSH